MWCYNSVIPIKGDVSGSLTHHDKGRQGERLGSKEKLENIGRT